MTLLTVHEAKRHFGELLLSAQRAPVRISENGRDAVVVISAKDYQSLENMKRDYLAHCFAKAEEDLANDNTVDGKTFLEAL